MKSYYWWARHKKSGALEIVQIREGTDKQGIDYCIVWAIGTESMYKKEDYDFIECIGEPSYRPRVDVLMNNDE